MSSLTDSEKRYLEKIFNMQDGSVLDYTDATFGALFKRHMIDIHDYKYQTYGEFNIQKMRSFWEQEPDSLVAQVLHEMLDSYNTYCSIGNIAVDYNILKKCIEIVTRLFRNAKQTYEISEAIQNRAIKLSPEVSEKIINIMQGSVDAPLEREFAMPNISKLPIEQQMMTIIEARLNEARTVFKVQAYLSVILLCGSVLEGVLLGIAKENPEKFNKSQARPKNKEGKVKPFSEWTLANLIDVASDIQLLKMDAKIFSHGLRDFRNYIHPHQQMTSDFTPDEHTAKICLQVLNTALADLTGDR
ncbi:MAG: hypothetical protein HQL75_10015 [Magnetococcales bacterium]|nr:hypothetical protein [Magnetococcales bacterium]